MGSNLNNNLAEYQYIQILTDNTTDFDGKDGDGGVSTPVKSVYKACFDYDITGGQSLDEFLWYLPHRYDDKNLAANTQNGHTIEFENEKNHLFAQKFRNASFRVSDAGALRLPVTTETIVVRPDAAGKNINDFEIRKVCARLALEDAVAPGTTRPSSGPRRIRLPLAPAPASSAPAEAAPAPRW